MRLKDKTALITGAASGIGEATAIRFGREGAAVVVADIDEENGRRVAAAIAQAGGRASFVKADILDTASIENMIAFAAKEFGRIDILHNNAQTSVSGRIGEISLADWQRSIAAGLTSYWYASQLAVAEMLKSGGGSIVNTASVSALAGDYGLGPYNAAKAGVVNMTRVFAIEYAQKNIRCNAVCPGPIGTPILRKMEARRPQVMDPIKRAIPIERLGLPD